MKVHTLAVIPARFASTRFPAKMLMPLRGKPIIQLTYEQTIKARLVDEVLVATDDERVVEALAPYGTPTVMTSQDHPTGTDRIAEVVRGRNADIIVNVQGDEPLIDPETIDAAIQPLVERSDVVMSTARHQLQDLNAARDPNVVKVICDTSGLALYFSRSPIPFIRDTTDAVEPPTCYWQHIGLYVFRREFLLKYTSMPQTPLEKLEKLEQLRALESGYKIAVIDTNYRSIGVDVPEDYERLKGLLEARIF